VSDQGGLYEFDCATKEFALILKRRFIKSASQHIDGTIWMTDTTNVEGYKDFQTDTLTRVRPAEPPLSYTKKGARFYKARWYYRNAFSYGRENPSD
jgi:hypothetical protein